MKFENTDQVVDFVNKHIKLPDWVVKARDTHTTLNALVNGVDFNKVLIERIEKIESSDRSMARKKYSKDIRDLFSRVTSPRDNVFSASGGSIQNEIKTKEEEFLKAIKSFKGQKSVNQYLEEVYFNLTDVDPNGVLFMEYIGDEDIYPTYKSINDIQYYKSNGQLCEVLMFSPKAINIGSTQFQEIRVVDDAWDYSLLNIGDAWVVSEERSFQHPFGQVPAVILSNTQVIGSEVRKSTIHEVVELSKDYARDKSILNIYKFQNGFPKHGKYEAHCRSCQGTGKTGDKKETCKTCSGKGFQRVNDVTDTTILDLPRDNESPIIAPNTEWFVSPDLETWAQYNDDLKEMEDKVDSTMWGTKRVTAATNETATGRFIDVQPVINRLTSYSHNVEWVHNQLTGLVQSWTAGQATDSTYHFSYGHRFIIEGPDVLLKTYIESRDKGANNTILDKELDEYILAKYQNNSTLLNAMLKKREVEPYVHQSIEEVSTIFGAIEAYKKVMFVDFWEEADTTKEVSVLKAEFKTYSTTNSLTITTPPSTT
jgi:hypothetical protein